VLTLDPGLIIIEVLCDSSHKFDSSLVLQTLPQCSIVKRTIVSTGEEWFELSLVPRIAYCHMRDPNFVNMHVL